jgi:hypothetical protein
MRVHNKGTHPQGAEVQGCRRDLSANTMDFLKAAQGLINIMLRSIGFTDLNRYWLGDFQVAFPFIVMLHCGATCPFTPSPFLPLCKPSPRASMKRPRLTARMHCSAS